MAEGIEEELLMRMRNLAYTPLSLLAFVVLNAQVSWSQLAAPKGWPQPSVAPNTQQPRVSAEAQRLIDLEAKLEQRISDKYLARLDALAIEKRSFEWSMQIFPALAGVFTVAGAFVAYRFGKSFKELTDSAREDAAATFRKEFFGNADHLEEVATLRNKYETAKASLEVISQELKGYSALAETARRASGFDPLVEYFTLGQDIDIRSEKTTAMRAGDTKIQISETTLDVEFRQRAAVVFERLLEAVRRGRDAGQTPKVGAYTLYDAAANASKADLDFVSLQFMQAAFEMSSGRAPDIASRYIRQQLTMSAITAEEAKERIGDALANTSGYDLHLVVSEAYNVGMRISDPAGMANLIESRLPAGLRGISYVQLNNARLRLLGNTAEDWAAAEQAYCKGIRTFSNESNTARWYEYSGIELSRILYERPDFVGLIQAPLNEVLGKSPTQREFVRKFGEQLARILRHLGILDEFVIADETVSNA